MVNLEPCMAWWIGGMSEWRGLEVSPPYAESMNNEGKSALSLSVFWEAVSIILRKLKSLFPYQK